MEEAWMNVLATWLLQLQGWLAPGAGTVSKDIIQLIREDHERVRVLWKQYSRGHNTMWQKQLLALDIVRHSSIHSKKEDMVLAPALSEHTSYKASEVMLSQHQELEEQMEALLDTSVRDPYFDALLQKLMQEVEEHLQEEERDLLPELQKLLSQQRLLHLGRQFEWSKLIASTRPHAWAPKSAIFSHIINALLMPVDAMKDMVAFAGAPTI